jgi:cation:H+ antiporter
MFIAVAALLTLPGIALRLSDTHPLLGTIPDTFLYGLTIIAAAFLLTWGAEAAQVDVSAALAVAFVGLIAVLPEYSVDLAFAWKAGQDPLYEPYAVANMTGANRLLVGAAWPLIFFLFWLRARRGGFLLERSHSIEILVLAVATIYSFILPFKGSITVFDTVLLTGLFVFYIYLIAKAPKEEPHLIGPAETLGVLPRKQRRIALVSIFIFAAIAVLATAEPFAEGLIHTGVDLGVDEFLLVQWLAPFASEAPEFLVAGILAFRGHIGSAMGALISSKINQWTLLIGGLPVVYALSKGELVGLPLDGRQVHEVFLTAAQSAFAVAILANLNFRWWEAAGLFILFAVQFAIPSDDVRLVISTIYCVLAVVILVVRYQTIPHLIAAARQTIAEYGRPATVSPVHHGRDEP